MDAPDSLEVRYGDEPARPAIVGYRKKLLAASFELRASWAWRAPRIGRPALALLACLGAIAAVAGLSIQMVSGPGRATNAPSGVGTILALPLLVPFGMWAYANVASRVNKTTLVLTDQELKVSDGPLPWWGSVAVPTDEVERIYACPNPMPAGKHAYEFEPGLSLRVRLTNGKSVKLTPFVADESIGPFLQRELEEARRRIA